MLVVMLVEMGCHVRIATEAVSTSDYTSYPEKYESVEALLSQIEEQEPENAFYRIELTSWYTLMTLHCINIEAFRSFPLWQTAR